MLSILKYLAADAALREIVFWLMGGFYYAVWKDVELVLPAVLVITFLLLSMSWKLNIISMGDEEARTLGINPEFYKSIFILLAHSHDRAIRFCGRDYRVGRADDAPCSAHVDWAGPQVYASCCSHNGQHVSGSL